VKNNPEKLERTAKFFKSCKQQRYGRSAAFATGRERVSKNILSFGTRVLSTQTVPNANMTLDERLAISNLSCGGVKHETQTNLELGCKSGADSGVAS
jgi:hypothetical protein